MGWPLNGIRAWVLGVVAGSVLLVAGLALADGGRQLVKKGGQSIGYQSTNAELYRSGITGADQVTLDHATTLAFDKIYCGGLQTIAVSARNTTASATVVATVLLYNESDVMFEAYEFTLTVKAADTLSSEYLSNPYPVDTEGAAYARIKVAAPSAGTLSLWTGVY